MKRVTLSMPCFGRPQRTIRAIECVASQTANNWEALITGDGCPIIQDFIDSNYFYDLQKECKTKGNDLIISNHSENKGGNGYAVTNINRELAKGNYFLFFDNDDIILPNHLENYLSEIEGTDYDFVYFNTEVKPTNQTRFSKLQFGCIGHSELIIRTEFLRQMPPHTKLYGHDWTLIENMMQNGKSKKAEHSPATYWVMSLSDNREQGID